MPRRFDVHTAQTIAHKRRVMQGVEVQAMLLAMSRQMEQIGADVDRLREHARLVTAALDEWKDLSDTAA